MDIDAWFYREELKIQELTGLKNLKVGMREDLWIGDDTRVFPPKLMAEVTGPLTNMSRALEDFVVRPINVPMAEASFEDRDLTERLAALHHHLMAAWELISNPDVQNLILHTDTFWEREAGFRSDDLDLLDDVPF